MNITGGITCARGRCTGMTLRHAASHSDTLRELFGTPIQPGIVL